MTPGPVQLRVEWTVWPQQAVAVGAAAHTVISASRYESGCVACTLVTDMGERVTMRILEAWDSEVSLRRHLRSPVFEALTGLLESSSSEPVVEVTLPDSRRGLDYVREVQHPPNASTRD